MGGGHLMCRSGRTSHHIRLRTSTYARHQGKERTTRLPGKGSGCMRLRALKASLQCRMRKSTQSVRLVALQLEKARQNIA